MKYEVSSKMRPDRLSRNAVNYLPIYDLLCLRRTKISFTMWRKPDVTHSTVTVLNNLLKILKKKSVCHVVR